jgi:diguanylate cyclase (GGDEF)-like protein
MPPNTRTLEVEEELGLATKLAGVLFLTGGLTAVLLFLLPGVGNGHWGWTAALAPPCVAWGLYCLLFARPEGRGFWFWHVPGVAALLLVTAACAATGGADSPARFYLFFVLVYTCYFFPERQARLYVLGCVLVALAPLVYDGEAIDGGYLGEVMVLCPAYLLLGGLIMKGKTQLVALREQARTLSLRDPLTDLANRRAMLEWLREATNEPHARVGLMLVDLDGFKDVNTLHGFPSGDAALRETARMLERCVRTDDMVARLGGDEFAVLAPATDPEAMAALSQCVLDAFRDLPERLELEQVELTASLGWVIFPDDADSVDDLIAAADLCLRGAKLTGKDRALGSVDWAIEAA